MIVIDQSVPMLATRLALVDRSKSLVSRYV